MKKLLICLVALIMTVSMVGCVTQQPSGSETTSPTTTLPPQTTAPTIPHSHEYVCEQVKNTTCDEAGLCVYRCDCGYSYNEDTPALGHSWADWFTDKPSSLNEKGTGKRMCTVCDAFETKELELLSLEEALMSYDRIISGLPYFNDASQLTVHELFDWVRMNVGSYSSNWNPETYVVTNIYSLDDFDAFTSNQLAYTYDFKAMATPGSEFTVDAENNHLIWTTYGAGGGWYEYQFESYVQQSDTTYTVRYGAKNVETNNIDYYGQLLLELVDGRLVIRSHIQES